MAASSGDLTAKILQQLQRCREEEEARQKLAEAEVAEAARAAQTAKLAFQQVLQQGPRSALEVSWDNPWKEAYMS